ncbi:MAG: FAD-binding protein [Candidatus Lokiarchaeota archaeon]|nr:FAD-binding protein [Candidatus Lokiarchaeota archaeon]
MSSIKINTVIKDMKDILGKKRYITADPGILDTYAFNWNADNLNEGKSKFANRPLCVVLPKNIHEIIRVVKYCNDNDLQFKAQSTGWGVHNTVGEENKVILLDLRRMNKILDIDEKNMIMVVEPYVNGAQAQAELFKYGLNCHIAGCGANASLLASVTSMVGQGWTGVSTGFSNRNILGVEWVQPDGNLCQVGSWGSFNESDSKKEIDASEWFLADGPGPSLRGVYRGYFGAFGGLGVFTKAAIKLYYLAGPPELETEGHSPAIILKKWKLPKYADAHMIDWQKWEDFKEGGLKLAQSGICWSLCRNAAFIVALAASPSNTEFYNNQMFQNLIKELKFNLTIITMANSKREAEYQDKVIRKIIENTNGEIVELIEAEPFKALLFMAIAKQSNTMRGVFRAGGGFFTSLGALGSWDWCVEGAKIGKNLKKKEIEKGGLVDDGADNVWGLPYENGTFSHLEELYMYDVTDPESRKASIRYLESVVEASKKYPLGLGLGTVDGKGSEMHNIFGPLACNYHKWLKKIKEKFDPNNASDPGFYINPKKVNIK